MPLRSTLRSLINGTTEYIPFERKDSMIHAGRVDTLDEALP